MHPKSARLNQQDRLSDVIQLGENGSVRGWVNHDDYTGFIYTDLFKEISFVGGYTLPVDYFKDSGSFYGCFDMAGNSWDWTCSVITAANGAERGQQVNTIR